MRGLATAIRTLSILPLPGREAENPAAALPWFPVVGALLGWVLWGCAQALGNIPGSWPQGSAFVVLLLGVLLTRGLHLDGLADCADGLGGGYTREQRLAIMKDSRTGVFGVAAVVLLLLGKWIFIAHLLEFNNLLWLPTAWMVSRTVPVALAVTLPYAREKGTGAGFVRGGQGRHLAAAIILACVLIGVGGGPFHLVAWLPAGIFALLWGAYTRQRLGGVTGDVLGAAVEVTETLVLLLGCFR
jgi:adenosylcobinamide-GDP ribazoletransferase